MERASSDFGRCFKQRPKCEEARSIVACITRIDRLSKRWKRRPSCMQHIFGCINSSTGKCLSWQRFSQVSFKALGWGQQRFWLLQLTCVLSTMETRYSNMRTIHTWSSGSQHTHKSCRTCTNRCLGRGQQPAVKQCQNQRNCVPVASQAREGCSTSGTSS